MPASTLDALQSLKDAEFHALCDEILPRIYPRYYPLVPLGRNERGNSIKGQPDSYVGETAKTCRIAIQYTVQQDSWWSKAVDDVEKARKACPLAQEIVVVLPRDVDRQLPTKGKGVQWQFDAKSAAAPAELTVIHGQTLTQQLDTTCQDLRFLFLGIPISRLSWHALMAGCREANVVTLRRLESLGRYDPSRYVDREADHRFFKLWQESLRSVSGHYSASDRKTLIPLIADSGIGKTSLLAHFAERASLHTPVLLLLARDLSFDKSESLAAHVMERLQGSMDSKARSSEESHLAMILAGKTPLTVVLDGLDETTNTPGVRRAIDTWIWSRLGRSSVLVATSRPEFWRNCRDATWANSILRDDDHPKAAKSLRYERDLATLDPMQGIEIPGKFTERELLKAWCRGGRDENEIWQLPVEVRRELLHPFTMRSALDLIATGTPLDQLSTRSAILELWIQSRLKAEVDIDARITEKQYRACLLILARMAVANPGSWIGIEQLDDSVPRFDRSNPPGGAVERLIAANILETHPEHRDQIRFSFEAVLDFFLAESLINEIAKDPPTSAREFAKLSFSTAVTRLERIGAQIASQPFREEFVRSLADLDGSKAAVVVRPSINSYSSECRAYVVSKVAKLLTSRMEAKRALATELLGRLNCEESRNAIEVQWATNTPTKRIYPLISNAAISHGIVALVPHVFRTRWFSEDHYFVDLRPELFASAQGFRNSLAEYSCKFIPCESHSDDYRRALMVLAYLNDERAVVTIRKRTQDRIPFFYESMCLLAIGSRQAIEVYSSLIDRYIEARKVGLEKEQSENWFHGAVPYAQIANLVTTDVEDFVCNQIDSDDPERQLVGSSLARWLGTKRLLLHMLKRWHVKGYHILGGLELGRRLGAENWIELWRTSANETEKKTLILIARDLCDAQIENILIATLNHSELGGYSAQSLALMGSQRASPAIRNMLATERDVGGERDWHYSMAFHALVTLRDAASVPDIVRYLESQVGSKEHDGAVSLAFIGTEEAENALLKLKQQSDELLVRGLIHFGSRKCIDCAIEIAKQRHSENAAAWLVHHGRFSFLGLRGRSKRQYRTDVEIQPLLDFVLAEGEVDEICDDLISILTYIDSPGVRTLLRKWYDLRGTPNDLALKATEDAKLSDMAYHRLADRGDDYVLKEYLERETEHHKDYQIQSWDIERLACFDRTKVRSALRTMLEDSRDEKTLRVTLDLVGHVGDQLDIVELDGLIKSKSEIIANAAFEAKLRLTDPLRLAEHW